MSVLYLFLFCSKSTTIRNVKHFNHFSFKFVYNILYVVDVNLFALLCSVRALLSGFVLSVSSDSYECVCV